MDCAGGKAKSVTMNRTLNALGQDILDKSPCPGHNVMFRTKMTCSRVSLSRMSWPHDVLPQDVLGQDIWSCPKTSFGECIVHLESINSFALSVSLTFHANFSRQKVAHRHRWFRARVSEFCWERQRHQNSYNIIHKTGGHRHVIYRWKAQKTCKLLTLSVW